MQHRTILPLALYGLAAYLTLSFFCGTTAAYYLAPGLAATDRLRVLQLLLVFYWSGLSIFRLPEVVRIVNANRFLVFLMLAMFLAGALSSVQAVYPKYAWLYWAWYLLFVLAVLPLAAEIRSIGFDQGFRIVLHGVAISSALYSLYYYYFYLTKIECLKLFCAVEILPSFDNPRTFSVLQTPLLILYPLCRQVFPQTKRGSFLFWLIGALWFSIAFVAETRSSWLAVILAVGFIAIFGGVSLRSYLRNVFLLIASGALAFVVLHGLLLQLEDSLSIIHLLPRKEIAVRNYLASNTIDARWMIWNKAFSLFLSHPYFGVGPMHFSYFGDIPHNSRMTAAPHNFLLESLSEWGGLGSFPFLFAIVFFALKVCVRFFKGDRPLGEIVIFSAWMACWIEGGLSAINIVLLVVFSAFLLVFSRRHVEIESRVRAPQRLVDAGICILVLISVALVCNGIYPDILYRKEEYFAYRATYPKETIHPRFWAQGQIAFSARFVETAARKK